MTREGCATGSARRGTCLSVRLQRLPQVIIAMKQPVRWKLFEVVGVEIEYMIVDSETLGVRPVADELFHRVLGEPGSDVPGEAITWSNELVNHVVELKTTTPTTHLRGSLPAFQSEVARVNRELGPLGARLMPSAMHPWMDPSRETRLWPGEYNEVFRAFDRIFDCRGHGWSNLQSVHLNLPFSGDEEFVRLHAAIRLVLPLLPALAASSPFEEGQFPNCLDNRMRHYLSITRRVPEIAGQIIPEPVRSEDEYRDRILKPMWEAIAPFDPDGLLRMEWLNSRGAIARFERGSIEIRVIDSQECPEADLAIAAATAELVRALVEERWSSLDDQLAVEQESLVSLLHRTIPLGGEAIIESEEHLKCLGLSGAKPTIRELWRWVLDHLDRLDDRFRSVLDSIVRHGSLAERLLRTAGRAPDRSELKVVYGRLCEHLSDGKAWEAA